MVIQSVQRAIDILSLFTHAAPRWGIAEMARTTGLAKTTVHNLVNTLAAGGFLRQDGETRKYQLGHRIFTLGAIMAGTFDINLKASGPVHQLMAQTGLVTRVAVWDSDAALVTLEVAPQYGSSISRQIGPRVVAYCSALGRALLAFMDPERCSAYVESVELTPYTPRTVTDRKRLKAVLDRSRERGFAVNDQELAPGQSSIAAPIHGSDGALAAAVSVTGSPERVVGAEMQRLAASVRATAAEISRYLGHFPATPVSAPAKRAGRS
jgi:DNA-binding IclR family transcriptional regulator